MRYCAQSIADSNFSKRGREKVAEVVINKNTFGDPAMVRRVINQFADLYSTSISRKDIDALISATRIEAEAKKLGGPDKFFTQQFLTKAIGQSR